MQSSPHLERGSVESGTIAVADHAHFRTQGGGKIALTAVLIAALVLSLLLSVAIPARAVDLDELTVVTMARDGSWGVATAASQGPAIAAAIHDCRAMARGPSDCGAQFITTRGGWAIASLCGSHRVMVTADTREDVEQAALVREVALKARYAADWAQCRRVLTVNPGGGVMASQEGLLRIEVWHGER